MTDIMERPEPEPEGETVPGVPPPPPAPARRRGAPRVEGTVAPPRRFPELDVRLGAHAELTLSNGDRVVGKISGTAPGVVLLRDDDGEEISVARDEILTCMVTRVVRM